MRTFTLTLSGPSKRVLDEAIFASCRHPSRIRLGAGSATVTWICEEGGLDEVQDLIDVERIESWGCEIEGLAEAA